MFMKLSDRLVKDAILIDSEPKSKKELIEELVDLLVTSNNLSDRDKILDAVYSREDKMSTGIGCGLAVPHAKVEYVDKLHLGAITCKAGVDFEALDKEPVYIIFLILSPENTVGPHIRALSSVSRLMADSNVRGQLIDAKDAGDFMDILVEAESKYD
jgi:mannitol/fructose-specific phosphotransferase system IIA component (Ntr-type)